MNPPATMPGGPCPPNTPLIEGGQGTPPRGDIVSITTSDGRHTCHACGHTWTGGEASIKKHWATCTREHWPPDTCVCCGRPWTSQTPGGFDPTDPTEQDTR